MKRIIYLFAFMCFTFTVTVAQNVIQAEYFFDDGDLGYGLCTPVALVPASDSTWQFPPLPVSGLNPGGHRIYIRVLDDNQEVSHTIRRYFEIPSGSSADSIIIGEWFVDDNDAGFDNCIPFSIAQADTNIVEAVNPDITTNYPNLAIGNHKLYLRTKSTDGKWSHTLRRTFEVLPSDDPLYVVEIEFFDDVDLGYGNCELYSVLTPFEDGCWTIEVPYPYPTFQANDTLFVRVRDSSNSRWSHTIRVEDTGLSTCYVGQSESLNFTGFNVYPNPASSTLYLEIANPLFEEYRFELYNVIGEVLLADEIIGGKKILQLNYPPGVYFVRLNTSVGSNVKKIVIQ